MSQDCKTGVMKADTNAVKPVRISGSLHEIHWIINLQRDIIRTDLWIRTFWNRNLGRPRRYGWWRYACCELWAACFPTNDLYTEITELPSELKVKTSLVNEHISRGFSRYSYHQQTLVNLYFQLSKWNYKRPSQSEKNQRTIHLPPLLSAGSLGAGKIQQQNWMTNVTCDDSECCWHGLPSNAGVQYTPVQAGVILLRLIDEQRPVAQNLSTQCQRQCDVSSEYIQRKFMK